MNDLCPCCYRELPMSSDVIVSLEKNSVVWKGHVCELTPTEAEIVYSFNEVSPKWLSDDALMTRVYGHSDASPSKECLRVHFCHIRRKFRDADMPLLIEASGVRRGGNGFFRLAYGY